MAERPDQAPQAPGVRHAHVAEAADDVLAGGSLYWVIKGVIWCASASSRSPKCATITACAAGSISMPKCVRTAPQPRRAFQGWRYLDPKDAPADLGEIKGGADLPEHLRRKLVELGAW